VRQFIAVLSLNLNTQLSLRGFYFEPSNMSSSAAGQSNVGFPSLYEGQNQQSLKKSEAKELRQHTGENVEGFLPSV
jgi:hypothetical protein